MKHVQNDNDEGVWIQDMIVEGAQAIVCVGDDEDAAENLLTIFVQQLPSIWSALFSTMKSAFVDYGHPEDFPPEEFFLGVSRMTPDVYMGDKSSFFLRFEFETAAFSDTIPFYDFFLDEGFKIVHHQPVF